MGVRACLFSVRQLREYKQTMRRTSKSAGSTKRTPKRSAAKAASYVDDAGDDVDGDDLETEPTQANAKAKLDPADSGDESVEGESFEVEAILGTRARHGKRQFKIRWRGYGPADDTWEDEENIDSPELVAAFLKGPDEEKPTKAKKSPKQQSKKRCAATSPKSAAKKAKKEDADENDEWEVSKIVDFVNLKDGTRQFLVQWKGYSSKENTWEPEANLNCQELIDKFLENEREREESTREMREVRKQVYKYNPELTKRSSGRAATKKRISYHDLE